MEKWEGRVALVTGASMGSGRAIAKLLASHGMRVAACARSIEKLQVGGSELNNMGERDRHTEKRHGCYRAMINIMQRRMVF